MFLTFLLQYLDCLWSQIQKLKKDRWQERHILRPYLAFDSILCEALQHNLPPFTPPPHTEDSVYPMPRVIFRMFDYTDDPEVCDCCGGWWADFTVRFLGQYWSKCDVTSPRIVSGLKTSSSSALVLLNKWMKWPSYCTKKICEEQNLGSKRLWCFHLEWQCTLNSPVMSPVKLHSERLVFHKVGDLSLFPG